MEALDNRLNSNNPMLIAEVLSKLVENVTVNNNDKLGFNYLKKKCLDNDPLISQVAGASIIRLVENGTLQIEEVMADFITSISTASNVISITTIISHLFYLQLLRKSEDFNKQNVVKLQILQHPFIKILQGDAHSETQMCMYNEIVQSYKDLRLSPLVDNVYWPVYLYCICSPKEKSELSLLNQKLWSFLLKNDQRNQTDLVQKLCCWIQIQTKMKSELSGSLINEALQIEQNYLQSLPNKEYLILLQILVVYNMVLNNANFLQIMETIMKALSKTDFYYHNLSLLILSKAVLVCSPIYLEDLLKLCLFLLKYRLCKPYSYLALKSSVLPWIASPSLLTQNALKIGEDILKMNAEICQERPVILASRLTIDRFHYSIFCNPEIFLALELGIKMECTQQDELSVYLENFESSPVHFLRNSFSFLCGLLLSKKMETNNRLKVFSMIVKCSSQYTELCPTVLTVILYQLSNTQDNRFLFELLKALPLMAKVKENVPKIITTVQAISNQSKDLGDFALRLMYETWEIDNKCYSSLETILNKPRNVFTEKELLESNISRAYIFKKLAEKRPEFYGRDLVVYLSKMLNECVGTVGSVPTALAIEGITHLCKAEIIDIVTTWGTLALKFKEDTRVPVIKSLCKLISQIPHLQYTQSYEKLNDEVIQHLWNYVATSDNEEIINAALDGLASFHLELICSQMPDVFLDENYTRQHAVGGQRLLPGTTWLTFLSVCKSRKSAETFLIKLVSKEIDEYLKYVYQVKVQREPENYGGLPTHSIVRGLGEFVKRNAMQVKNWENTDKENIYIVCLKILSLKYSKPLPPLDWCFLQELIHNPKMKKFCLDLASHQAVLSGSARRLVESYIVVITENPKNEDSMHIARNLKYLANSIQPMVIKPFIENSLHCAFNNFDVDSTFGELLNYFIDVLKDDDVQHINKNVIEDVLRQLVFVTDISSKAFPLFLNCIVYFSQRGKEEIAKFNSAKFEQTEFEKITKIRCYIAKNANSLHWLNDIFEVASRNSMRVVSLLDDLTAALKTNLNHEESPSWLMEHFGQIQAKVAERCDTSEIEYFCDVLAVAVVYFSGFFVLIPKYDYESIKYFFPAALAFLLDEPRWTICTAQVLEWLHYMNTAESISQEYRNIYGWSLCCLRHQDEFSKSSKWMKYLDCDIPTNNKY